MHLAAVVPVNLIRFKSCYHVEDFVDEVFLFSEKQTHRLQGKLYGLVSPLLKQATLSEQEIVDRLADQALPEEIHYALQRLEAGGYLERVEEDLPPGFTSFCHLLGVEPALARKRLQACHLSVLGIGSVNLQPILSALEAIGLTLSSEKGDLTLVVTDDYSHPQIEAHHQQLKDNPWILLKPKGCEIWLGPLFQPGQAGCWVCLDHHIKRNDLERSYVRKKGGAPFSTAISSFSATEGLAAHFAASELLKWIVKPEASLLNKNLLSFDALQTKFQEHRLLPLSSCKHCGKESMRSFHPPVFSGKKRGISDGGYRSRSAEQTLKSLSPYISPILGVVSSLHDSALDSSLHVYYAGNNFAVANSLEGLEPDALRSRCSGKGQTEAQAKASCLCEGIERYSGIFQGDEPRIRGSYRELKGNAIQPNDIQLFSSRQFKIREEWNRVHKRSHRVPRLFSECEEIEWSPVWSLTGKVVKYLPTALCYYSYPDPSPPCYADSNGNAAGNCLEEAILQGFYELVERDSVAIWWYNRILRNRVDVRSFADPYLDLLLEEYAAIGRDVWVLDITSDLPIPTFVALSKSAKGEILFGFGAHLNASIALSRALTEMNQFLPLLTKLKLSENDWLKMATIENQPYLRGHEREPMKVKEDYPKVDCDDLLRCQSLVEERGMEMLILDQSRDPIDLKVVKVIVPGLRHFWPRFAPGRLYDVPVAMGWLKKPLQESELNPIPMFI